MAYVQRRRIHLEPDDLGAVLALYEGAPVGPLHCGRHGLAAGTDGRCGRCEPRVEAEPRFQGKGEKANTAV